MRRWEFCNLLWERKLGFDFENRDICRKFVANDRVMSEDTYYNGKKINILTGYVSEPETVYYPDRISLIRNGLPVESLQDFQEETGLTNQELAYILNVSVRTLQRYQNGENLPSQVTEKLLKLNELYEAGERALGGGPKNTTAWLRDTIQATDYKPPLEFLDTYRGMKEMWRILGRIEYGIPL